MLITNLWGGPSPYYRYNTFFNSENTAPVGENTPGNNWARFRSDAVDQAMATIAGTNDEAAKQRAYSEIQHTLVEEMPYIPLVESPAIAEFRTDEATGWPTGQNPYAVPAVYQHPDVGIVAANLKPAG